MDVDLDPSKYLKVPYRARLYPGNMDIKNFRLGSNCESFLLGVADDLGFLIKPMRARELWYDIEYTERISIATAGIQELDFLFFLPVGVDPDHEGLKKLHIGIHSGGFVLHNSRPRSEIRLITAFSEKYLLPFAKRPVILKS